MNYDKLTIAEGDTLTLGPNDTLSTDYVVNNGTIDGEGSLVLDWATPIEGVSVDCPVQEINVPALDVTIETAGSGITVSCEEVGAFRYTAVIDGSTTSEMTGDPPTAVIVGLADRSEHTVQVKSINSRSNEIESDEYKITVDASFGFYEVDQADYTQPQKMRGSNAVFMARLVDKSKWSPLSPSEVDSITMTAYRLIKNVVGVPRQEVDGFSGVSVSPTCVLPGLTPSPYWTRDNGGINFIHVPDQRTKRLFPIPGAYVVEYEIRVKTGNPINLIYEVFVY